MRARLRRRSATVLAVALAAIVLALAGGSVRAQTAPVTAIGWWTDRVLAEEQADSGFEVARALDGTSVAAVALDPGGESVASASITLTENGGLRTEDAAIVVCATDPFLAANGGDLADAPATECAGGVELTRGDDGTWTGDISAAVSGSAPVIAIVPAPPADDAPPLDPGFSVTFDAPVVALTTAPATSAGGGVPPTTAFTPPTTSGGLGFTPTPTPAPSGGFSAPPTTQAPATTVAPAVDEFTSEQPEIAGPNLGAAPISGGSGDTKPWIRLLILLPLSGAAGAATVFGQRRLATASA